MIPEQVLYYSDNCFGTTDTISFKAKLLRIHDLKNGDTPANMKQLKVYTSLFLFGIWRKAYRNRYRTPVISTR